MWNPSHTVMFTRTRKKNNFTFFGKSISGAESMTAVFFKGDISLNICNQK